MKDDQDKAKEEQPRASTGAGTSAGTVDAMQAAAANLALQDDKDKKGDKASPKVNAKAKASIRSKEQNIGKELEEEKVKAAARLPKVGTATGTTNVTATSKTIGEAIANANLKTTVEEETKPELESQATERKATLKGKGKGVEGTSTVADAAPAANRQSATITATTVTTIAVAQPTVTPGAYAIGGPGLPDAPPSNITTNLAGTDGAHLALDLHPAAVAAVAAANTTINLNINTDSTILESAPLDATLFDDSNSLANSHAYSNFDATITTPTPAQLEQQRQGQLQIQDLEEALDVAPLPERKTRSAPADGLFQSPKYLSALVIVIVFLMGAGAGLAIGILARTDSKDSSTQTDHSKNVNGSPSTTSTGTFSAADSAFAELNATVSGNIDSDNTYVHQPFDESILHSGTIKGIQECSNFDTEPLCLANQWMVEDPNLESYPAWRKKQRFGLAMIYFATGGPQWHHKDHWLDYEISECQWWWSNATNTSSTGTMPRCTQNPQDNQNNLLLKVELQANNLAGSVPYEAQIPTVKVLDLSHNRLMGNWPIINGDSVLEEFILAHNFFYGPMTAEPNLGKDEEKGSTIRVVRLEGNAFEGLLHYRFGLSLSNLEVWDISGNSYGGYLPPAVEYLTKLTTLRLGGNQLTGTIPSELGMLLLVEELDFSDNTQLTGTIPQELVLMRNLTMLDVSRTSVSGSMPVGLCNRTIRSSDPKDPNVGLSIIATCNQMFQCCWTPGSL